MLPLPAAAGHTHLETFAPRRPGQPASTAGPSELEFEYQRDDGLDHNALGRLDLHSATTTRIRVGEAR